MMKSPAPKYSREQAEIGRLRQSITALESTNAELLAALKNLADRTCIQCGWEREELCGPPCDFITAARAAIAKAEEEEK